MLQHQHHPAEEDDCGTHERKPVREFIPKPISEDQGKGQGEVVKRCKQARFCKSKGITEHHLLDDSDQSQKQKHPMDFRPGFGPSRTPAPQKKDQSSSEVVIKRNGKRVDGLVQSAQPDGDNGKENC